MSESDYAVYVGIDWATETHYVVARTARGDGVCDQPVPHDAVALQSLAAQLTEAAGGDPTRVAIALEVPHGAVVDALLERGFHVYAINPKQLDRFRDRYTVAGAKDDRRDGRVLASALATDRAAFRRLRPEDPAVLELRAWSRLAADLQHEIRRLANRLREQVHRVAPTVLALEPAADEPWFWTLLRRVPLPADPRVRRAPIAALLTAHRIRRFTADDVLAALRAPALPLAPGTVPAARAHIQVLLPRLELAYAQYREAKRQLDRLLEALAQQGEQQGHRDVTVMRSCPGIGTIVAATMLAEASRLLAAREYHALRAHAGVAPVTRQSGKHRRQVSMRYACNPRLRNALYSWTLTAMRVDGRSHDHYHALRARGHTHGRCVRGVGDRLLNVLVAALKSQSLYDPDRRRAIVEAA